MVEVAKGMGMDKRIGLDFLKAGIGYGGSCFPKDVKAIAATARQHGYKFRIIEAVMEVNQIQRERITEKILALIDTIEKPTVGLLGLAFKPNTDDLREAPSLYVIEKLIEKGITVKAYDPIANEKAKEIFPQIEYCQNAYDACKDADVLSIITDWEEFASLDLNKVRSLMKTPAIVDARNIFEPEQITGMGFNYVSVGR